MPTRAVSGPQYAGAAKAGPVTGAVITAPGAIMVAGGHAGVHTGVQTGAGGGQATACSFRRQQQQPTSLTTNAVKARLAGILISFIGTLHCSGGSLQTPRQGGREAATERRRVRAVRRMFGTACSTLPDAWAPAGQDVDFWQRGERPLALQTAESEDSRRDAETQRKEERKAGMELDTWEVEPSHLTFDSSRSLISLLCVSAPLRES
jgi:hypothetical protein